MLETLIKGIIIGIVVSAPLGPVGALCIKETLRGGRRSGMLAGIGAMLSDMLYAAFIYWGIGQVLDLITTYDVWLRLVGGIVILIFAAVVWHNARQLLEPGTSRAMSKAQGLGRVAFSFTLTLSNPLITLLIIPLFVRLEFVRETSYPIFEAILAISSIGLGCILWWYWLTYVVSWISRRVGTKGIRKVNYSVALVLAIIGLVSLGMGIMGLVESYSKL